MFWFYKLAVLAGLEHSSEETQLISDVPGDLLGIVDRDHSMICRRKKDVETRFNTKQATNEVALSWVI